MPTNIPAVEQTLVGLLVVAALVAIAVSYLRLPYTIALVVVGLFIGFGDILELDLSRDLILLVFLPPLLFEGAINMDLDDLRRRWVQVGILATLGTGIVVAIATAAFLLLGFQLPEAVLMGVILAPTDPVSVLAVFREHGVGGGLRTIMEGESIFNDAFSIVLYLIALEFVERGGVSIQQGVFEFGSEVLVGAGVGAVAGFLIHRLMRAVDNHLVEITLSLATAFGAYLIADQLHGSGVIATVTAGLLIGNYGTRFSMSASSRVVLFNFWEVVAFVVNSLLFLLTGVNFDVSQFTRLPVMMAVGAGVVAILVARALVTYGVLAPFTGADREAPISRRWQHAIFWGGLRGAIPIALVLGLGAGNRTLGGVDTVAVVFGVVLFSLLAQGLTYKPLLARLGLIGPGDEIAAYEEALGRRLAVMASLDELEQMHRRGGLAGPMYQQMHDDFEEALSRTDDEIRRLALDSEAARSQQVQRTARRLAAAQRSALVDAARRGLISDEIGTQLAAQIDEALEVGLTDLSEAAGLGPGLYPSGPETDAEREGGTKED